MSAIEMTPEMVEALFNAGVHIMVDPDKMAGVHLAPGEKFIVQMDVVLCGKSRR